MENKPRSLFVGPKKLGLALQKHRTDLEFVQFCDTITEFWEGLDNETIDTNVDVIFTIDHFFDEKNEVEDLENMVATMSPHCLMIIVQYNPKKENLLRERIRSAALSFDTAGEEEFYFISASSPNPGIDEAKSLYIEKHPDSDIAYALRGVDRETFEQEQAERALEKEQTRELKPGEDIAYSPDEEIYDDSEGDGTVIVMTSTKGGTGVSTASTLLATYIAHATEKAKSGEDGKGAKVCLVDFNLRNGQLGFFIGALKPSIVKLRSEGVTEAVLDETVIYSEKLKCDCLLMPQKPRLVETLTLEFLTDVINLLKKRYDYVIIDVPCSFVGTELDVAEKVAYPKSDLIVYVTDCSSTSLLSMTRWIEIAKSPLEKDGMNIPVEKLGVIVNDYIPDIGIDGDKIAKLSRGLPIITAIPSNRKLAIKAANQQAVSAMLRDETFKESIATLAVAVVGTDFEMSKDLF